MTQSIPFYSLIEANVRSNLNDSQETVTVESVNCVILVLSDNVSDAIEWRFLVDITNYSWTFLLKGNIERI